MKKTLQALWRWLTRDFVEEDPIVRRPRRDPFDEDEWDLMDWPAGTPARVRQSYPIPEAALAVLNARFSACSALADDPTAFSEAAYEYVRVVSAFVMPDVFAAPRAKLISAAASIVRVHLIALPAIWQCDRQNHELFLMFVRMLVESRDPTLQSVGEGLVELYAEKIPNAA